MIQRIEYYIAKRIKCDHNLRLRVEIRAMIVVK